MRIKKYNSFEEAKSRLEEIVKELEKPDLTLEQSIKLYEEGTLISKICNEKLSDIEQKITILSKGNDENE